MKALNINYEPTSALKGLSETTDGKKLWDFLCSPENQIRMETATFLRKPALEPLAPYLREAFSCFRTETVDKSTFDNYKKLAGSMARQVMVAMGYEPDRAGVGIKGDVFASATRYKKPE